MKSFIQSCLILGLLFSLSTRAQAQPIITIDTVINATCNASSDGGINITVAGTPGFTYAWSNGATTEDLTGLFSGSYVVTVTDGVGASTISGVLTVNAPPLLNVNTDTIINISCEGDTNGAVNITVLGGVPGFTYLWSNGATTEDVTGLGAGPANLTVTDANGCTSSSKSIFLDSVPAITFVVDTIQNISCNGVNDGYINMTASGGVGNFTFSWDSGQNTEDISALAMGVYNVTATDSNGCTISSGPHNITQPGVLTINLDTIIHLLCNADGNGEVQISVNGGSGPFSYNWSNGATTEDIVGLNGDVYFVTVTDTNGCIATSGPHVVNEPTTILVTVDTIISQLCAGDPSGAVNLSVINGTPGYTYLWDNGETTQDVTGLYSGSNNVTVTDANGCTASAKSIFLDSVLAITITLDSIIDVSCNGANNGGVFISVAGGTGGSYTYLWDNGATTQDITGLAGNNYSVTVTDSNSCVMFSGPHLVNEPSTLVVTFDSLHHVDCNGADNGAVFITTTGGTTGYSFTWSNGMTSEDITGIPGGNYTVIVTDANGCVDSTGPHTVNEPTALVLTLDSIHHVDCNGNGNGAVFVTTTGGTTAYNFLWDNGMMTEDIAGLNGGNYTLTVTDANGCTITDTAYVVNEPTPLVIALDSVVDVTCNGFGDGGVFVTTAGGSTNYTFLWDNGATTENNTGLNGGNYTLTVSDANGCSITSGPHNVNEPAGMTITLDTIIDVSCNGAADGSVAISVSGGAPSYTFAWDNGMTTEDIAGLSGGTYNVTVTDANGCTLSDGPHVVDEDSLIVITVDTVIHVTCNGEADGSIAISVSGGVPAYTFLWDNGMVTEDIVGLNGGNYSLTVTDAAGCTMTSGPDSINEPTLLVATFDSLQHVDCNGANNGAVFVTTTGGTTGYSFVWNNSMTTEDITGLAGGSYSLMVTDVNGCVDSTGPHVINEPTPLAIALDTIIDVTCNGATDGAVMVTISGGTTAYSFLWDNGMTTEDITGLSGGSYSLTTTDANGCTLTSGPHLVNEETALVITFDSVQNVSCNGAADGGVFITTTGGLPAYTFLWDNGMMTEDIIGLSGGNFTVTATDADGCTATSGPHTVNEPAVLTATLDSITNVNCNGANDGAIYISIAGGTIPFSYNWDNGGTTQDISGLIAGSYSVTVTDSNSCVVFSGAHLVTEPTAITINLDSINFVTCNGAADGAVFVTTTGGSPAYSFAWDNGITTENITGLSGGNYTLTVTDANGCTLTHGPDSVVEPAVLMVVVDTFKNESCFGIVDGYINTSPSGGTAPFSFVWNTGAITDDISGLIAGTYTVTITDSNSCVAIDSVIISDVPSTVLTLGIIDSVSCNGLSDGSIDVTTSQGAPGYTWLWSNSATTEDISGLAIGTFSVTVTDSLGCIITGGPFDVFQPDVLAINLDGSIVDVSCNGAADGAINTITTGGTLNYNYLWNNSMTTEDISGLSGSNNTVTVTDANGCSATSGPHNINEETLIVITLDAIDSVSCNGASDGSVSISVAGGVPTYTYNWDNGAGTPEDPTGLAGNNYSITVTDADGCTMTSGPHTVNEPTALTLSTTATVPLEGCLGEPFGQLDATANGGTGTLQYLWSNGTPSSTNNNLNTGNYTLTVTDANGCTISGLDSIMDPLQPIVNPFVGQSPITDTTINWNDTISIYAGNDQTAAGVTYEWTELSSIGNINFVDYLADYTAYSTLVNPVPDSAGTYTLLVTATSPDGCVASDSIHITVTIQVLVGIPTAFSPNGDGTNDYFRPAGLDHQFITEFKIYNRWGQIVHDGTDTSANWDGKYLGVEQPTEVYIYFLRYQIPGQDEVTLRGEFTLLR